MKNGQLIPLISIIVPVYKAEKYLEKCITSIQEQTCHNFEVIVIDDGSPDGSGKICDDYAKKDSRFKVFHQANQGIGKTRLIGIQKAIGEYIVWIDADDWVEPHLLERLLSSIKSQKSDIVVYGAVGVDKENKINEKILWKNTSIDDWRRETVTAGQSILWNFMVKRSLWNHVTIPEAVSLSGEDGYLTVELFFKAKTISYINEILYFHLLDNPSSVTHNMNAKKYYAHCYLWNFRRERAQRYYKDKINYCAARALSNGVKAVCLSLVRKELDEMQLKRVVNILQQNSMQSIKGRYRDRFLAWCILTHKWTICRFYGKRKWKKLCSR